VAIAFWRPTRGIFSWVLFTGTSLGRAARAGMLFVLVAIAVAALAVCGSLFDLFAPALRKGMEEGLHQCGQRLRFHLEKVRRPRLHSIRNWIESDAAAYCSSIFSARFPAASWRKPPGRACVCRHGTVRAPFPGFGQYSLAAAAPNPSWSSRGSRWRPGYRLP
jgi:hypothetical protein